MLSSREERVAARVTDWDAEARNARQEVSRHLHDAEENFKLSFYDDGIERHYASDWLKKAIGNLEDAEQAAEDTGDAKLQGMVRNLVAVITKLRDTSDRGQKAYNEAHSKWVWMFDFAETMRKKLVSDIRKMDRMG
jgi:hypothetical protein